MVQAAPISENFKKNMDFFSRNDSIEIFKISVFILPDPYLKTFSFVVSNRTLYEKIEKKKNRQNPNRKCLAANTEILKWNEKMKMKKTMKEKKNVMKLWYATINSHF